MEHITRNNRGDGALAMNTPLHSWLHDLNMAVSALDYA
jgi:hypothetical protein